MLRQYLSSLAIAGSCAVFGLGTTSCGGGTSSDAAIDLVLLGFSQPNVAGVALNQPLIFTFSAPIDAKSITPDTLRIVGQVGPFFEEIVVDGNLVALLPRSPNFDDVSDTGLAPGTVYQVSMPTFPAVDTIESTVGKPLISAATYNFTTVPAAALTAVPRYAFVEPRRRLIHGEPPSADPFPTGGSGKSDDLGCLQNRDNDLYEHPLSVPTADPYPQQTNSVAGGRLLCLENEGRPRIIPGECIPKHAAVAVGTPAAGSANIGKIDLPAIVIKFNEQVDPGTVGRPYDAVTRLATNIRLYRVADDDGVTLPVPEPIETNVPTVVQKLGEVKAVLVASDAVQQGTYLVMVTGAVVDLTQKPLDIQDSPHLQTGFAGSIYGPINAALPASLPTNAFKLFFRTLKLPGVASSISESWGSSLAHFGDQAGENGLYTQTSPTTDPLFPIPNIVPTVPALFTQPAFTLKFGPDPYPAPAFTGALECGQTTVANWNGRFKFLNLPISGLESNPDADQGFGSLKAVWRPHLGDGRDGVFDTTLGPSFSLATGESASLTTTPGPGASGDGDGIYEFRYFFLQAGDTLTVSGARPLLILCRGDFTVHGTIILNGHDGGPGLDTDGTPTYSNPGAANSYGAGGLGGPGGALGGRGAGFGGAPSYTAFPGNQVSTVFEQVPVLDYPLSDPEPFGGAGQSSSSALPNGGPFGGGGGGHGVAGSDGFSPGAAGPGNGVSWPNGGDLYGTPLLERDIAKFDPDCGYSPHMGFTGGHGGGGGGCRDENSTSMIENGDDGGGGGGGGGGSLCVLAGGVVTVGTDALIQANGGKGGSTFGENEQQIALGQDNAPGGDDDSVLGVVPGSLATGAGAPGGGGAGGSILLMGEKGVKIQGTAQIEALGGAGGESGDADMVGGEGAPGRILLMNAEYSTVSLVVPLSDEDVEVSGTGSITPTPVVMDATLSPIPDAGYRPTVNLDSVGVSTWYDLFVTTVNFAPNIPPLGVQLPLLATNFVDLTNAGLTRGVDPGEDYEMVAEYQGADTLTPDGAVATGLVQWSQNINVCDGKRYFRYRVLFHVAEDYPGWGTPPAAKPLPQLLSITIPFEK